MVSLDLPNTELLKNLGGMSGYIQIENNDFISMESSFPTAWMNDKKRWVNDKKRWEPFYIFITY